MIVQIAISVVFVSKRMAHRPVEAIGGKLSCQPFPEPESKQRFRRRCRSKPCNGEPPIELKMAINLEEVTVTLRTGGCACGRVRYTLAGEPFLVGVCHCTKCRKESGSMFTAYAKWPLAAFEVAGKTTVYEGRSFCPVCGSRLFNLHHGDVEVRIGSLDGAPTGLVPVQEGWTRRREPWLHAIAGAGQFEQDPDR
jgi:hypothetical protein